MRCLIASIACIALVGGCTSEPASPLADMAEQHKKGFSPAIPILRVEDLKASQAYFRDKLGFTIEWTDDDDFSGIHRGDAWFFLCERCQGRGNAWSFIFVPDVDVLYKELQAKGANVKRPPKTEPWNLREMHVVDVDGNVIRFASSKPH